MKAENIVYLFKLELNAYLQEKAKITTIYNINIPSIFTRS